MNRPLRRDRAALVQDLAEQLERWQQARWTGQQEVVSSGSPPLDRLLPEGGFRRGTLVEWLAVGPAAGAGALALLAARQVLDPGGALVVIDRARRFYPPGAARLGIALENLILVRPTADADHDWALDQALRSPGVAAVWSVVARADSRTLRRWQLAAETSGVVGLLLRGDAARHEPSWADVRLEVAPLATRPADGRARRLRVTVLRARAAVADGRSVALEMPTLREAWCEEDRPLEGARHETRRMPLASQLAAAKAGRGARRA